MLSVQQKFSVLPLAAAITALLPGFLISSATFAQSAPQLEEVIVTAQKRSESLQDTPISISAFSQEALNQQGISSIDDLQGKVPSLNMTPFPIQNTSLRLFIRGVGASDIQVTQDPAVGVYVDQVYIGRSTGLALELADLAQIEVLRGPQGTLFGRNSIGGAISMTTIKPETDELTFKQELGLGKRSLFRSKTSANLPITDTLALRALYLFKEIDGFVDNKGPGEDFLDANDKGGKLDFLWEPSEAWSLRYAFDFSDSKFVSPTFQAVKGGPLSALLEIPVSSDRLGSLTTKDRMRAAQTAIEGHALTISYNWESTTFKSITAYREFEYKEFANLESGSSSPLLVLNSNIGIAVVGQPGTLKQNQLSQEFQIFGEITDSFDYVAGLYYFHEEANEDSAQGSEVFFPQPLQINEFDIDNKAYAAFAQSNWTPDILEGRFTLTTGIRYTLDERLAERDFTLEPDAAGVSFSARPDKDFDHTDFTVVGSFAVTEHINTYLKWATGYKSGGYNIRASNEASYVTGFNEEEIATWELGLKSELWGRRLRLNAAAYFSDYQDIQLNFSDASTPADVRDTIVINAGEGEISGLEVDLTAIISQGLTATFSYAYQDPKFTKVVDPDDLSISEKDFVFSNAPKNQYNIGLTYSYPLTNGVVNASLNYNWVDERFDTQKTDEAASGASVIDDYALLSAFVEIADFDTPLGQFTVSLWGRNLTDEEYFTSAPVVLQTIGAYEKIVTWGEPLTYGIDLVYNFRQ
jgi:iron complex outermembrane receptor protein